MVAAPHVRYMYLRQDPKSYSYVSRWIPVRYLYLSCNNAWDALSILLQFGGCIWRWIPHQIPVSHVGSHVRYRYLTCKDAWDAFLILVQFGGCIWRGIPRQIPVSHVGSHVRYLYLTWDPTWDTCIWRGIPREIQVSDALDMHLTRQPCISRVHPASHACLGCTSRVIFLE